MRNDVFFIKGLAKPAQRALANAGLFTLKDLSAKSEMEITALHGIGKNALNTIKQELEKENLSFKK